MPAPPLLQLHAAAPPIDPPACCRHHKRSRCDTHDAPSSSLSFPAAGTFSFFPLPFAHPPSSNPFLPGFPFPPSWRRVGSAHQYHDLREGEVILMSGEDMTASFYVFRVPKSWYRYLALNGKVELLCADGVVRSVNMVVKVLPMGWSPSVGLLQVSPFCFSANLLIFTRKISKSRNEMAIT